MASWKFVILGAGLLLSGCIQTTLEPAPTASLKPHDRELLARAPYVQARIPEPFQRHIVDYHRREAPGTIVIDTDNRYLYLVQADRKAIRFGVTVGEEAQGWSGVAKVGSMAEWPGLSPNPREQQRPCPLPAHVAGGSPD